MGNTLDDIRAILFKAEQSEIRHEGIGKNEFHPLAYRLKRNTDELFQDTRFRQGYRGVRSPDLRENLSFFEYDKGRRVLDKEDLENVDEPDEYFQLYYDDDEQRGEERFNELSEDSQTEIEQQVESLFNNRLEFIRNENKEINKTKTLV